MLRINPAIPNISGDVGYHCIQPGIQPDLLAENDPIRYLPVAGSAMKWLLRERLGLGEYQGLVSVFAQ